MPCGLCKCQHPIWRCQSFKEKTTTQRAKIAAENELCFSCLKGMYSFRTCPRQRKCTIEGCRSTHKFLLHGAESILPVSTETKSNVAPLAKVNSTKTSLNTAENAKSLGTTCSSGPTSITDVKFFFRFFALLQVLEVDLLSPSDVHTRALVLCDKICSHSWISSELASCLQLKGTPLKLTMNGKNTQKIYTNGICTGYCPTNRRKHLLSV